VFTVRSHGVRKLYIVLDRTVRIDEPDEPGPGPVDQRTYARDDLRQRLERIADNHPSSARYAQENLPPARSEAAPTGRAAEFDLRRESGWLARDVAGHPDRPAVDDIHLPDDRARHILDGDGPGTGGGHRHGTGRPGKTEFPAGWPDNVIVSTVVDIAHKPDVVHWQAFNNRWRVVGRREGLEVSAVVLPDGRVWAAWPEPGGVGVTQNPRA
jgi:hypothetical protein